MISKTTKVFRAALAALPEDVRRKAKKAYHLFCENPHHPSLRFKKVHSTLPVYSVRVGIDYRAVGVIRESNIIWFWVGSHADYDAYLVRI